MLDLSQIEVVTEKETTEFGKFIIEPLDQGYGHTIGNSLRRVLLSSLAGAAITQVKISQAKHQFSSLPGMTEDVVEFILNLKKVKLKISGEKPVKLTLDLRGPKEVKAKDIEKAAGVEITNGDLVLAHLSDSKARLTVQMVAENGRGYSLATERAAAEIGVIPIDANFSPISSVNYSVDSTRVGRITNYDKLTIELKTDGTIKPSEALKQAAKILQDLFMIIYQPPARTKKTKQEETIGDFLTKDRKELTKMKNGGPKSIELVEEKLRERSIEKK